jgi:hypothetical protein
MRLSPFFLLEPLLPWERATGGQCGRLLLGQLGITALAAALGGFMHDDLLLERLANAPLVATAIGVASLLAITAIAAILVAALLFYS